MKNGHNALKEEELRDLDTCGALDGGRRGGGGGASALLWHVLLSPATSDFSHMTHTLSSTKHLNETETNKKEGPKSGGG